jgi:DNA polymerase elongation subunit (family B)
MSLVFEQEEYINSKECINSLEFPFGTVLKIEDLGYVEDFVYDLETESGDFGAGVGCLIVKNTDSVFLKYQGELIDPDKPISFKDPEQYIPLLEKCFEAGEIVAAHTTKLFKDPILLEFEKIYLPLIMLAKKVYLGKMYEPPRTDKYKMDFKGIVLKRRDNANITKLVYQGIVDILFTEGEPGVKRAVEYLNSEIQRILDNQFPFEDLVVTKTYKTNYKSANIPHKILAEKMYLRDPGSAPKANDRVPYVFLETKDPHAKQYEKVEHPDYAKEHNLKIDALYYMDQIKNPITQLLMTLMTEEKVRAIFDHHRREYILKKKGLVKITDFFKPKEKNSGCIL